MKTSIFVTIAVIVLAYAGIFTFKFYRLKNLNSRKLTTNKEKALLKNSAYIATERNHEYFVLNIYKDSILSGFKAYPVEKMDNAYSSLINFLRKEGIVKWEDIAIEETSQIDSIIDNGETFSVHYQNTKMNQAMELIGISTLQTDISLEDQEKIFSKISDSTFKIK